MTRKMTKNSTSREDLWVAIHDIDDEISVLREARANLMHQVTDLDKVKEVNVGRKEPLRQVRSSNRAQGSPRSRH